MILIYILIAETSILFAWCMVQRVTIRSLRSQLKEKDK